MNECEIHEEETPITLHESHQHPTPAQQKSLDGHPNDLTSGPAFAASEYERYDKMAAAALAYKCMEVAHMRVVYSKATRVNQDRHELRIGLQNLYLGDSPSSSGSDLDNVYNDRTPDKDVSSKMAGYRAVVSGNRLKIERVLNFTKDVNKAMDASTKCQMAFAAAKKCSDDPKYASEFSLVKKAISSSFHEVDTVIYLVQLAMEAIND
ncbi:hypothetical protein ACHQM5_014999 [Ranunculus cassubicifolius]